MKFKTEVIEHRIKLFNVGETVEAKSSRTGFLSGTLMTVQRHIPGRAGEYDDEGTLFFEEEAYQGDKQRGHSDEYWGAPYAK